MEIEINEKERLKKKINELKERLEEISEEDGAKMGEKGEEYAQMFRERGRDAYKKARVASNQINDYAHEHPWVWMSIGVLAGMTIGAILSMKSCKKYCR